MSSVPDIDTTEALMEITLQPDDELLLVTRKGGKLGLRPSVARNLTDGDVFKIVPDGPSYRFRVRARFSRHVDTGAVVLESDAWHVVCRNGTGVRVLRRLLDNCAFSKTFLPRDIEFPDGQMRVADIQYA